MSPGAADRPLTVFLVAGEESGDILGAALMQALSARVPGVRFAGVGGERMTAAGLASIFPLEELALHGFNAVVARLPNLFRRLRQAADAAISIQPDVVVLVDAPAFNLRLARRLRRRNQRIPIVDYVSPTVWAYNPGRARQMARNVDELLAILPFEPAVHQRLGGPKCVYVGHPLLQRLADLRPAAGERPPLASGRPPTLLVLPGSRRSEIRRLMTPFGAAVALIAERMPEVEVILPAVARLQGEIVAAVAAWPHQPTIVSGEAAKFGAFRRAHAALAASGTVTLELALAGVPMAVAYRVDPVVKLLKWMLVARTIVLANLILDQNAIPEFIDGASTPERLATAVVPLLADTPQRRAQIEAFARLDRLMATDGAPADLAAGEVLDVLARKRAALAAG